MYRQWVYDDRPVWQVQVQHVASHTQQGDRAAALLTALLSNDLVRSPSVSATSTRILVRALVHARTEAGAVEAGFRIVEAAHRETGYVVDDGRCQGVARPARGVASE